MITLEDWALIRTLHLSEDPYHGPGEADGLCFSVPDGIPKPPSLRTIDNELQSDLGITPPDHGNLDLRRWSGRHVRGAGVGRR